MATPPNKPNDRTIWGIHAGATGDAHALFHNYDCIALGWEAFGDLSKLPPNRDGFKAEYNRLYPGEKPMNVAVSAGQLFRFIHEMRLGDLVIYPSKVDKLIHSTAMAWSISSCHTTRISTRATKGPYRSSAFTCRRQF